MILFFRVFVFVFIASLLGCVSNKKHREAIDVLNANHKSELDKCNTRLATTSADNEQLNLQLAERKGEVNILMSLRHELKDTIAKLEYALENMGSQSASEQQNLNTELFQKQNTIKQLNLRLQGIDAVLNRHTATMEKLALDLGESVQGVNEKDILITTTYDHVKVIISESFLFKNKSTTRLEKGGLDALEKMSAVIARHPDMRIMVVGHTDNSTPDSSYKNNWNFSVLQSATIANTLTGDFELSHNQVTAAGKGEFNPRTSNSTPDGKAANRRIELLIAPNPEDLVKAIRNEL